MFNSCTNAADDTVTDIIRNLIVLLLVTLPCTPSLAAPASTSEARKQKLRDQYRTSIEKIKPDDYKGREAIARWCRQNQLKKEADDLWQEILRHKRDELARNPAPAGYLALAAWCDGAGLSREADEARRDAARMEYLSQKASLKAGDVSALMSLADWCQRRRLTVEALESLQSGLRISPSNSQIRARIDTLRTSAWREAPTGLLRRQPVPGYTNETAWYHISVPKEYNGDKGLPLFLYLHGGAHEAGTADNVVALAQVMPPFKKAIVVFPNHLRTWWAHPREMTYLVDTLDAVTTRWRADEKRIYLMGASMGGNGVWGFGSRCPELFAAVSPVAGFYAAFLEFPIRDLSSKPVYILHGTRDSTVPIGGAREAFGALKKLNAPVEMREVECEHQPPTEELNRAAEWLLRHTNSQTFDLTAIRDRVGRVPVAGWLRQYKGN